MIIIEKFMFPFKLSTHHAYIISKPHNLCTALLCVVTGNPMIIETLHKRYEMDAIRDSI